MYRLCINIEYKLHFSYHSSLSIQNCLYIYAKHTGFKFLETMLVFFILPSCKLIIR